MNSLSLQALISNGNWSELTAKLSNIGQFQKQVVEADFMGRTPFHMVCTRKDAPSNILQKMYEINKCVLEKTDSEGNTPLHSSCGTPGTVLIVKTILDLDQVKNAELISKEGKDKLTPLELAWLNHMEPPGLISPQAARAHIFELDRVSKISDLNGNLGDLWDKTTLLLVAADRGAVSHPLLGGKQWRTIHAIAKCGGQDKGNCPTVVMWLALKLYRRQVAEVDEDGNLPLHIAAASPLHLALNVGYTGADSDMVSHILTQMKRPVIDMLVKAYPKAASLKNCDGRLPLNLAIESEKPWGAGIETLMEAAPLALETMDFKTRLYPFMLAAANDVDF